MTRFTADSSLLLLTLLLSGCATGARATPMQSTEVATPTHVSSQKPIGAATLTPSISSKIMSGIVEVTVDDYYFYPSALTVTIGTTVRWTNVGAETHDVTATVPRWTSPYLSVGDAYEFTFQTEGAYQYACTLHSPEMRGTIVVTRK